MAKHQHRPAQAGAPIATRPQTAASPQAAPAGTTTAGAERMLREEGAKLAAEYWRRMAAVEETRRQLNALDQVLLADFPSVHDGTGRRIAAWVSPDKLSATEWMRAIKAACAKLRSIESYVEDWRAKAARIGKLG